MSESIYWESEPVWDPTAILDRVELATHRVMRGAGSRVSSWYKQASMWVRNLSDMYDREPEVIAGIIAALSPQVGWHMQQKYIPLVLQWLTNEDKSYIYSNELPHPGFTSNKDKAIRIWKERDLSALSGQKVEAFCDALSGDINAVVIDMHMVDLALGISTPEEREGIGSLTENRYNLIAESVSQSARLYGVSPRDMQATLWEYQRTQVRELGY